MRPLEQCLRGVAAATLLLMIPPGVALGAPAPAVEQYEVVQGWPELPAGEALGGVTGVDVDSGGSVWVFHRAGREWVEPFPAEPIARSTVWAFDGWTGRLLRSWGANLFVMPHGLAIDADDNLWLTDVGLHQVFKFAPDGKLLLTLGEAGVPGDDARHFDQPTDVAVASDGSIFVSDGYGNARVLKFAPDGRLLHTWGSRGTGPGQFDLPHSIAIDSKGQVLVADRSNSRVQLFDQSGKFLAQWRGEGLGRPYAVAQGPGGRYFVADGGDQPEQPPDRSGVAVADEDGRPLARFGRWGNYDGQFQMAHDLAIARDGAVYVADVRGERVQKFLPARQSADAVQLQVTIAALDQQMFDAYNAHDVDRLMALFAPDLEFYHDTGGLLGHAQVRQGFTNVFANNKDIRRALVAGSLEVYPIKDHGAIEIGAHRFCHTENGEEDCGTFRFVHVWRLRDGAWQVSRAVSYGH